MAVGKIAAYDCKDNWNHYIERLEQYFLVNSVQEELKVATLITVVGAEAYELLISLCTPAKPSAKTFLELVALMKNHLNPKPSILAERFKFRQRTQKEQEKVADYLTGLKKLSKDCGFDEKALGDNLRDQFVCGLKNEDIRQRLFTEDDDITLEKAFRLATSMEAAEKNAAMVEGFSRGKGDKIRCVVSKI